MKIDDFVSTLGCKHPNGRFVHDINQKGGAIQRHINYYLKTDTRKHLFIAHEYLKELNKVLGTKYSLRCISELTDCELLNEVEDNGL